MRYILSVIAACGLMASAAHAHHPSYMGWQYDRQPLSQLDMLMHAQNPKTSAYDLRLYARHWNTRIRKMVAGNPAATAEILRELGSDPVKGVRIAVLMNPNTPLDVFLGFEKDRSLGIRRLLSEHPRTTPAVLVRLSRDGYRGLVFGVIRNPNTPPDILSALLADSISPRRMKLSPYGGSCYWVINPTADRWNRSIQNIWDSKCVPLLMEVVEHPATPVWAIADLVFNGALAESKIAGMSKWREPEKFMSVRRVALERIERVAADTHTPPEVLDALAGRVSARILNAVVDNPSAPIGAIVHIAYNYSPTPEDSRMSRIREEAQERLSEMIAELGPNPYQ